MDYKNKILKYKLKKNKIINKIDIIIKKKKKNNLENIKKIISEINIIPKIINDLMVINNLNIETNINEPNINEPKTNNIFLIICGIYSVGKSSICSYLENIFDNKLIEYKININSIDDINLLIEKNKLVNNNKITLIESNLDLIEYLLNNLVNINNNKIYLLHLIPLDINIYKNKLINKIFNDIRSNTNNFKENINKINNNLIKNNNFDLIYLYKSLLKDDDFNFLNEPVKYLYEYSNSFKFDNKIINMIELIETIRF